MIRDLIEPLILLISSLITLIFNYFKIPITAYQQIIVVLMVVLLVLYNKFSPENNSKKFFGRVLNLCLLLVTSLIVELLIFSTGAIFSPFLILLHLYTLGLSFLLNLRSAMTFLVLSISVLAIGLKINPSQIELIKEDPGTVLLYTASMIVVIPLSYLLATKYHLKEELSLMLSKKVKAGESILESLYELVIITDTNLNIVSINEAIEKLLKEEESQIIGKNILDVIKLQDLQNSPIDVNFLSVRQVIEEKSSRKIPNLLLYTKSKVAPFRVSIQVRPILDAEGKVDQLSFVITEGSNETNEALHTDLLKAENTQKSKIAYIKDRLLKLGMADLSTQIDLIDKIQQDLKVAGEIEDHPIKESAKLTDVAYLAKQTVSEKQGLSQGLKVGLTFSIPDSEAKEKSILSLKESSLTPKLLPTSDFTIPLDAKWLKIMISQLIDLSLLLGFKKSGNVGVSVSKISDSSLNIDIIAPEGISEKQAPGLFEKYYPKLPNHTTLQIGSGLEGFIAKSISNQLSIPLSVRSYTNQTSFIISIGRKVRSF